MYKKKLFMMVITGICLLIGTMKSGSSASMEELEERLNRLETKINEVNTVAEGAKSDIEKHEVSTAAKVTAMEKHIEDVEAKGNELETKYIKPTYAADVCEGRIKFGGRVDGMVQYLTGTDRDELGVMGRLWFDARAKVVPEKLDFLIEFNSAGGDNIGAGLPTNEITIDQSRFNDLGRGNVNLYKAHTIWKPVKGLQIATGIMDWLNHEDPVGTSGDVGFDNSGYYRKPKR